jgi:hypothetical protein
MESKPMSFIHIHKIYNYFSSDCKKPRLKINATLYIANQIIYLEDIKMFNITDVQRVTLTLDPTQILDVKGNVTTLDPQSVPVWEISDPTICSLSVALDGMSAVVAAVGPAGTSTTVTVSADADRSSEVKTITGSLEIMVLPSDAVTIKIIPGTPEDNQ